jgi:hypothetical protein
LAGISSEAPFSFIDVLCCMAARSKLKVFRTPVGFHDAYVAAPSQKAALAIWGVDANLFAQGLAEIVVDPALTQVALSRPGEVVKVPRGSAAEHIEAAGAGATGKVRRDTASTKTKNARRETPRPSRAAVESTLKALELAKVRHRAAQSKLSKKEALLAEQRTQLDRKQEEERAQLTALLDEENDLYRKALSAWLGDT